MLISNLNHLETLNETSEVMGGLVDFDLTQYNFAEVYQEAKAFATATSVGDDANAMASSTNYSEIHQDNDLDIDI